MPEGNSATRRLHFYAGNCYRFVSSPWKQWYISPEDARTLFGCSFGDSGWNHLRRTLEEYDRNRDLNYRNSTLHAYLTRFRPRSIADLLGIPDAPDFPLFVYPWGTFRKGETEAAKDPKSSRFCGPSSDAFVAAEFDRTIRLYQGMKKQGYRPWKFGNTFIGGTMMCARDGSQRFVVLQGNHRLAVLAHLGVRRVAVRDVPGYLTRVREEDAPHWPLVKAGLCSKNQALAVFRLFFRESGDHVRARIAGNRASTFSDPSDQYQLC